MEYFKRLLTFLLAEKESERKYYERLNDSLPVTARRAAGITWYPVMIKGSEIGVGDYLTVEFERPSHQDIIHQFRFGMSVAIFSNHDQKRDRIEGVVSYLASNRMKITLRTDELPEWADLGKLGIDAVFDRNSFEEMEKALRLAPVIAEKKGEGTLVQILAGDTLPAFSEANAISFPAALNSSQQSAVSKIISAQELAVVHGPPGTGKTTTLVQAIKLMLELEHRQILAVTPSNTAVDLISEKLADEGLNVVRVGNPARVSEKLMSLTLDSKMSAHPANKEIRRLRRQANEFRDMAHKYKRNFGKAERDQRKALFSEAHKIIKEVEKTEQYIIDDIIEKADVITATLIGANHYTVRSRKYHTVVIDEAGQALEPACWVSILKAQKLILAGDHQQLPPVIKSLENNPEGLSLTLLEKVVSKHPQAVIMLTEQYRMNEAIMRYSSRVFYEDRLQAHAAVSATLLFATDSPLLFIDTAGCGFEEVKEGTSTCNPEEAGFLLKHLDRYCETLLLYYPANAFPTVGVISPYKRQIEVLKEKLPELTLLKQLTPYITVNTIDSFQGQERDVIYISLTRSNADNIIGFLSEIRRMNVAMTRARKKLVVIGDSATLSQLSFYSGFITYAQQINAYHSAWEFMDI